MNFFIYLISEGFSKVLPFLTTLIVAKFIDVSSFGELTLYFVVFEILVIIIGNNITATSRIDYFSISLIKYKINKSSSILVSFIIFIIICIVGLLVSYLSYSNLFLLSSAAFFKTISSYCLSNLQCRENAKLYAINNLTYVVAMNISFITLILTGGGIGSWFYSIFLGSTIQFLYSIYLLNRESLLIYNLPLLINKKRLLTEYKYGLVFIPQAIGFWMKLGIDRVLLVKFISTIVAGHYMFSFQLMLPTILFSTVINLYLTPIINKHLSVNNIFTIETILKKFTFLLLILALLNYFMAYYIIGIFYYDKYFISLNYLLHVGISSFLYSTSLIYMNIFYYIDKKKFISYVVFFISTLQLITSWFAISFYNIAGILYANIVVNLIFLIITVYFLNLNFKRMIHEKNKLPARKLFK